MINQYLTNLIERINDKSDQHLKDSSKTIHWKALREAEKLTEKKYISALKEYLTSEKVKKNRRAAYFILAKLAKNVSDKTTAEFILNELKKEKDKFIISSALDLVQDLPKPKGSDLSFILESVEDKKWLIRRSAISALKNTQDASAEKVLIDLLEHSDDPYDITCANAALNNMGTKKAIPYLEKHLNSRKEDVKLSAELAIQAINERSKD
tara:strand:- start:177 stop:806 length:630 start_codon:yes stop_codon:yes gene_type:complete